MTLPHTPLVDQVRPLLRAGHLQAIAPLALHHDAADVAALLRGLEPDEAAHVFSALSPEQRAQTEDVQLASGIEPTETAYSRASVRLLLRKRAVWLEALLFAALVSASVIAAFEEQLASVVALAFYIPVVTGTGGNTGTQSAALVIRALATGDLRPGEWARVLAKEVAVGLMLGVALALTIFLVGSAWPGARSVAPVVGATMVVLVVWANLVGALLPLLLRRLGVDPAVAGAPLVSTLVDATGLLIYFGMAALLLP